MEQEESGNYLYILFILIGVSLLAVGAFYYFTDDTIKLEGTTNKPKEEEKWISLKESDIVKINFTKEEDETEDSMKASLNINNKTINATIFKYDDKISLSFNDKSIASVYNDETLNVYVLQNTHLLVEKSESDGFKSYIIYNSNLNSLGELHITKNGTYTNSLDKNMIVARRYDKDNNYIANDSTKVYACDVDKLEDNGISFDSIVEEKYAIMHKKDDFKFELVEGTSLTLIGLQELICN